MHNQLTLGESLIEKVCPSCSVSAYKWDDLSASCWKIPKPMHKNLISISSITKRTFTHTGFPEEKRVYSDYLYMKQWFRLSLLVVIVLATSFSLSSQQALPGDVSVYKIPDASAIRTELWKNIISNDLVTAKSQKSSIRTNSWGRWKIDYVIEDNNLYTVVSPERNGGYALYTQGTWIFKRSLKDGSFAQIKIFLMSNQESFMRIYPFGERTRADIVIYGAVVYHSITIPLSFENLATADMQTIVRSTKDLIDWNLFAPEPVLYANAERLVQGIREKLPALAFADDGAIDADGRARFIATLKEQPQPDGLNCSGFVKWITDGMLYPYTGSYLAIAEIKERMVDFRGSSFTKPFEEQYDPYFGIDWIRALSRSAWNVINNTSRSDPLLHDVDEPTFSLMTNGNNPINGGIQYRYATVNFQDVGFEIQALWPMLYLLAVREPGNMYFAALSARSKEQIGRASCRERV